MAAERYSVIENGRVVNQVLAEPDYAQSQGWVPAGDSGMGDYWNAETGYSPGPAPELPPENKHITRLAFRNRFSQNEKIALELAAQDNPAAATPERVQAAALRSYLADLAAATFVDLARTDTRAGVQFLESAGLLGAGRALVILDTPIEPVERPL